MYRHKRYGNTIDSDEYRVLSFFNKQQYEYVGFDSTNTVVRETVIIDNSPSILDAVIEAEMISEIIHHDTFITDDCYDSNSIDFGGGDFGGGGAGDDF